MMVWDTKIWQQRVFNGKMYVCPINFIFSEEMRKLIRAWYPHDGMEQTDSKRPVCNGKMCVLSLSVCLCFLFRTIDILTHSQSSSYVGRRVVPLRKFEENWNP